MKGQPFSATALLIARAEFLERFGKEADQANISKVCNDYLCGQMCHRGHPPITLTGGRYQGMTFHVDEEPTKPWSVFLSRANNTAVSLLCEFAPPET